MGDLTTATWAGCSDGRDWNEVISKKINLHFGNAGGGGKIVNVELRTIRTAHLASVDVSVLVLVQHLLADLGDMLDESGLQLVRCRGGGT